MTKRITVQDEEYFLIQELKGRYRQKNLFSLLTNLDDMAKAHMQDIDKVITIPLIPPIEPVNGHRVNPIGRIVTSSPDTPDKPDLPIYKGITVVSAGIHHTRKANHVPVDVLPEGIRY